MLFTALFMFILQRNVTPNGVMVGCRYAIVHLAFINGQILADEKMVYPDIEAVFVIRYPHTVAGFCICILQDLVELMVGV